jgi:hypothetical protein
MLSIQTYWPLLDFRRNVTFALSPPPISSFIAAVTCGSSCGWLRSKHGWPSSSSGA